MKSSSFHLNLLKEQEKLSSSPVRMRIMMPVGALLVCTGMLIWWAIVFGQSMVLKTQADNIESELIAKQNSNAEVIKKMELVRELQLQLEQLDYYRGGLRKIGEPLARLAEVIPLRVQITSISVPDMKPQNLMPPVGRVPLFGPPTNVETQQLLIAGRTTKETPVVALMEALDNAEFQPLVTTTRKVNSFQQDSVEFEGRKLLSFELEYAMPERKFAK
jgi:Tfp pilus assembly protein PilN